MELSIVIPCYNEADNLKALTEHCVKLLNQYADTEIILVNNGSKDNSAQILTELLSTAGLTNLKSLNVPVNKGYGYGILQGLNIANGRILCWTHADLQTDVFDSINAYQLYLKANDEQTVVKGKRKKRGLMDSLFTAAMQWYVLVKLGANINDINGQPKLFSRAFYNSIKDRAPHDFSLDLYLLINARAKGRIVDFPVYFNKRIAGEAKGGSGNLSLKIRLAKRTLTFINAFRKNNMIK